MKHVGVGPQLSLRLIDYRFDDGNGGENAAIYRMPVDHSSTSDIVNSFHRYYGTGSTFMGFFIHSMVHKLRKASIVINKCNTVNYHGGLLSHSCDSDGSPCDLRTLFSVLDHIEEIYRSSCLALSCTPPPLNILLTHDNNLDDSRAGLSYGIDNGGDSLNATDKDPVKCLDDNDDMDDTSWYFDSSNSTTATMIDFLSTNIPVVGTDFMDGDNASMNKTSTTMSTNTINIATATTTTTTTTTSKVNTDNLLQRSIAINNNRIEKWSDRWYMIGLQHCLAHELNPLLLLLLHQQQQLKKVEEEEEGGDRVAQSHSINSEIALPMHLAGETLLYLTRCIMRNRRNTAHRHHHEYHHHHHHHEYHESTTAGDDDDNGYKAQLNQFIDLLATSPSPSTGGGAFTAPINREDLFRCVDVRVFSGHSSVRSTVLPGAVVISCNHSVARNIMMNSREHEHTVDPSSIHISPSISQSKSRSIHTSQTTKAVFRRVVVTRCHPGVSGDSIDAASNAMIFGTSQQARSISSTSIVSSEAYLQSLNNHDTSSSSSSSSLYSSSLYNSSEMRYIHRIGTILQSFAIDLLLCESSMMTTKLVDHLNSIGIAIAPVSLTTGSYRSSSSSSQGLHGVNMVLSILQLTGATLIDDITTLTESDVGTKSIVVDVVGEVVCSDIRRGSSHGDNDDGSGGGGSGGGGLRCSKYFHDDGYDDEMENLQYGHDSNDSKEGHYPTNILLSLTSLTSTSQELHDSATTYLHYHPVTVLIFAPTVIMATALRDLFYKCLHRMYAVLYDDNCRIMIGGGMCELISIIHTSEVIDSEMRSYQCSSNSKDYILHSIQIYQVFQQSLHEYLVNIMMNNGYSCADAWSTIQHCIDEYREKCSSSSSSSSSSDSSISILTFLNSLTNDERCSLQRPIDLTSIYGDNRTHGKSDDGSDDDSDSDSDTDDDDDDDDYIHHAVVVLDPVDLKLKAFRSSIIAIKQELSIVHLY